MACVPAKAVVGAEFTVEPLAVVAAEGGSQ
jgi:hypothetical protein